MWWCEEPHMVTGKNYLLLFFSLWRLFKIRAYHSTKINNPNLNPYHAELYTQDITCMLNCFEEISQNLAFFLFLLCS
jgi:hypothetical protein